MPHQIALFLNQSLSGDGASLTRATVTSATLARQLSSRLAVAQNALLELLSASIPPNLVQLGEGGGEGGAKGVSLLGGLRQGGAGTCSTARLPARLGLLVEKLLEESTSPVNTAMHYTFFAK